MKFKILNKVFGSGSAPARDRFAFLALVKDIQSFPKTDSLGVLLLDDIKMKENCGMMQIYLTSTTQEYSYEQVGESDSRSFKVKFIGSHPGTELQALEFVTNFTEEEFVVLIPQCDKGIKVLGSPDSPLIFTSSHKSTKDSEKFNFVFEQEIGAEHIYLMYDGIITLNTNIDIDMKDFLELLKGYIKIDGSNLTDAQKQNLRTILGVGGGNIGTEDLSLNENRSFNLKTFFLNFFSNVGLAKVGINKNNPTQALDVVGNIKTDGLILAEDGTPNEVGSIKRNGNEIQFKTSAGWETIMLKGEYVSDSHGVISPDTPEPVGGWKIGWYTPKLSSAGSGTNYPNQNDLKSIEGFFTEFYFDGIDWEDVKTKIPTGANVSPTFDPTTETEAQGGKQISKRYDKLLVAAKYFLGDEESQVLHEINFSTPFDELQNEVLGTDFHGVTVNGYARGEFPAYTGDFDYMVISFNFLYNLTGVIFFAAINNVTGSYDKLLVDSNGETEIRLTKVQALKYTKFAYTRKMDGSDNYKVKFIKVIKEGVYENNIKKYVETRRDSKFSKVIYLEDYGAEVMNPHTLQGMDCTDILQNCLNEIFADPIITDVKIILKGMYKLSKPVYSQFSIFSQIHLPSIEYATNMKIKNIAIVGEHLPIWEDQGIVEMPVNFNGCGFYSTLKNQDPNRSNYVLSFAKGSSGGTFNSFNNVNMFLDNIYVMVNSKDDNGNPIINTMSGINSEGNTNLSFGKICIRTNVALFNSKKPNENTVGLFLPRYNNHGTIIGDYLRCIGFGRGFIATEHLQLGTYVGLGNVIGVYCQFTYPITINTIILEMNQKPIMMANNSFLQAWVYQTERVLDTSKWYASSKDIYQESGNSCVTIGRYIVHIEGGGVLKGSWDVGVRMAIIQDEFGQSFLPVPVWGSLPVNPVEGLEGYYNNGKVVFLNNAWKNALTLQNI